MAPIVAVLKKVGQYVELGQFMLQKYDFFFATIENYMAIVYSMGQPFQYKTVRILSDSIAPLY